MIWRDLRYAIRGWARSPAFTATAILSLALGIGANASIFSFVNAILLTHLPVPEPERLVTFSQVNRGEISQTVWRMRTVEEMAKRGPAFDGVAGRFAKPISFWRGEKAQWLMGELVTGRYFQTLRVSPSLGRVLTDDDVRDAKTKPVCVLSYSLWQSEFAGDPRVLGTNVFLNGHAYQVAGVTARGFHGADPQRRVDIQIPATRIADFMPAFGEGTGVDWLKTLSWLSPIARLRPGLTRAAAQAETQRVFREIQMENAGGKPSEKQPELLLEDGFAGFDGLRPKFGRPVALLMAVVSVVLLIACANLANMLMARAQAREKELAVRLSLGASRGRLVWQLFAESLVLAAAGGFLGLGLSFWMTSTLLAMLNAGRAPVAALQVTPDVKVLMFAVELSLVTALLFGLVPAWQATKTSLLSGLQVNKDRGLLRRSLVIVQLALSLVVVFVAGLLTQTLRTLETVDLGFRSDRVITLSVEPAATGHSSMESSRILDEILLRARALPDVETASMATSTPNGPFEISMSVDVPGYMPKSPGDDVVAFNFVTPDYFKTIQQPLLRGRDFTEHDGKEAPRVAMVNQKFAAHYFAGQDPVGRKFRQGGGDVEITGLVRDARDHGVRSGPAETVYMPEKQGQTAGLMLLVRSRGELSAVVSSLAAIVKSVDRHMPIFSVHTLDSDLAAGLSTERMLGYLSTLFAALATLLAALGLYGVIAYSVARRTREIAIRLAVGAQRLDVADVFARENIVLVVAGVGVGVPLALTAGRALQSQLFGITGADVFTVLESVMVLAAAAFLGMLIPLWRAARVDPVIALRYE